MHQQQQGDTRARRDSSSSSGGGAGEPIIGGYRLGREIGKGSFAIVVKAYHQFTHAPAAIKVVTRKKLTTKLLENLEGEISILKSIQHPNIVDLRDCLKTESHIYLVMAYCSCGDLSGYIKKRGQISSTDDPLADSSASSTFNLAQAAYPHPHDGGLNEHVVRSFLSQLASAIEFMRAMNIVHRDIKPQNLLLQPPEPEFVVAGHPQGVHQLKVADFGFARSLPAASLAETLCGSPLYMAPEILRYEKYDAKADLWSVGAVLFEMAVGKAPFRAQNHIELLRKIERGEDRIKFPDERSAGSLARENARRAEQGEHPLLPPHRIADDIKLLIRALLKRKAVERMSFEDFFRSPVIQRIEMRASVAGLEVSTTLSPTHERENHPSQILSAAAASAAATGGAIVDTRAPQLPVPQQHQPVSTVPQPTRASSQTRTQHMQQHQQAHLYSPPEQQQQQHQHQPIEPDPEPDAQELDGTGSTDDAYVLIEKRNVEVNELADELQVSPNRTQTQTPAQTQGQLQLQQVQQSPFQQTQQLPALPAALHTRAHSMSHPIVAGQQQSPRPSLMGFSPSSVGSGVGLGAGAGAGAAAININRDRGAIAIPGAGAGGPSGSGAGPSSVGSSSSLARAISLASVKLFGVPTGMSLRGAAALMRMQSQRRLLATRPGEAPDPAAAGLLATLEDLSQKAFVLSEFGDSRLAAFFPVGPHQPLAAPSGTTPISDPMDTTGYQNAGAGAGAGVTGLAGPSSFSPSATGLALGAGGGGAAAGQYGSPRPGMSPLSGGVPEAGPGSIPRSIARRTPSSSSVPSAMTIPSPPPRPGPGPAEYAQGPPSGAQIMMHGQLPMAAELAATEALMLYVRALNFIQRGTDMVRTFLDVHSRNTGSAPTTPEINEAVQWLRSKFNDTYEKAEFAKARSGEMPEAAQETDKLIFDRALEIARAAAVDELENNREGAGWDRSNCVLAYETAHAMLLTLLDPGEEDLALSETSIGTIEKFVRSISRRLQALRPPLTPVQM